MDSEDELYAMLGAGPARASDNADDDPFSALGLTLADAPAASPPHQDAQDTTNVMREVPPMAGGLPMPTMTSLASALADRVEDASFDVADLGSRVTLNEDGTCQLSDDVRCYHPLYRPRGCYEGRGINFKQARNGRSLFFVCDKCGDKWNQIPPSDLKPGENPRVTSSKRRTDKADPTRCGGYHCTTCGRKKNKKLASELGVPHCVCPKKDKEGEKEEGEGEEEGGLGLPSLSKLPAALPPIPMPPMSESDAAKQAALEAVRVCQMMGGAQFTTVDAIASTAQKRKLVAANAVQAIPPAAKRPTIVAASVAKATTQPPQTPAASRAVAVAAPVVVPAPKKSRIRVTQLAGIGSTAVLTSQVRPPRSEEVDMEAVEKEPAEAEESDDDDGDTNCTYCATALDRDHQVVQYSVQCSHRKCSVCVCIGCAGFQTIKQARREKQWFCRGHKA